MLYQILPSLKPDSLQGVGYPFLILANLPLAANAGRVQESSMQSHLHLDSGKDKTINLKALVEASAGKEIVDLMDSLPCAIMLRNGTSRAIEIRVFNTVKVMKTNFACIMA